MNATLIGLTVAACVFAGGLGGLFLHSLLPEGHRNKETQDVVRLGTGMLSVLASLVLGLLIATAKQSYDRMDQELRSYAANLLLLNETLRDYGDGAATPRQLLREHTIKVLHDIWPAVGFGRDGAPIKFEDRVASILLEHVREAIRAMMPIDAGQKWLQDQALQISSSLLQQRLLLIEQEGTSVQPVILVILVSWISFIFASFGLNAPRNATVIGAFLVCSLAIGGAVFLVLEMDSPLRGVMKISSGPMEKALTEMRR
jgi:hypothetical protein